MPDPQLCFRYQSETAHGRLLKAAAIIDGFAVSADRSGKVCLNTSEFLAACPLALLKVSGPASQEKSPFNVLRLSQEPRRGGGGIEGWCLQGWKLENAQRDDFVFLAVSLCSADISGHRYMLWQPRCTYKGVDRRSLLHANCRRH